MPDTIVPIQGQIATTNMHVGGQLPACEWARKVAHGQGNILANYTQMIFTNDDAFEDYWFGGEYWWELANHKFVLPHLATHFAVSFAVRVEDGVFNPIDCVPDWQAAAALRHNASGEIFWSGTGRFTVDLADKYAGTRVRWMIDALEAGVLTSGHMDELWRMAIYIKPPTTPDYGIRMRTWAHAFYGGYLPLK